MKIVVLGGGDSPEREVSLRSASAVTEALGNAGYETQNLDPSNLGVLDSIPPGTIVFPVLHGVHGEDGFIQNELERRQLPYLGSNSKTSAVCFDKVATRQAFEAAGLPIAIGASVTSDNYTQHPISRRPHVLKISNGGSSIGTLIVRNPAEVKSESVAAVFELGGTAVLEELVEGVEITVPILDTKALPVIEIKPPKSSEFDYENKYNGLTEELCPPVSISKEQQLQAQKYAEQAHAALGCRHLSRTDIIVSQDGSMVLLEINTMPGMTDQSLYPKSASAAGISFPELMSRFVSMVNRDFGLG